MRIFIDRLIELFKWPVALYMLFSIPAYYKSFYAFNFMSLKCLALAVGIVIFYISRGMAGSSRMGMQIIAHECTHAFFAILTLHKVTHIKIAEDDSGGDMSFKGKGNWLIVIAPYFFPLFCFCAMIGISIYTTFAPTNLILNGILGYFTGYHIDTVVSQIHDKQTDLPKVSYKFCLMFLPGANMWMLGSILAYNSRGWEGIIVYQKLINYLNARNWDTMIQYISSWL